MTMSQLTLDFRPGLTAQHRSLREVTAATVYGSHKGVAGVAGDLDMSPTDLTKRLNLDSAEPRPLRVDDLEKIIASTQDYRPIYWLIEKFLRDPDSVKQQAVSQLATLLPQLIELTKQAGIKA
jgi:hypothetical protein